jgi:hypoxanthine phosphoribosyltransferase
MVLTWLKVNNRGENRYLWRMKTLVADLEFELSIPYSAIQQRTGELAAEINTEYAGKTPLLVGVMNGSFIFMAELVK